MTDHTQWFGMWTEEQYGGALKAACLKVGRIKFGVGWLVRYSGTEVPLAFNRSVSWRHERILCLSILRLRIGLRVMPTQ